MATIFAKIYIIPTIAAVRSTGAGEQYIVEPLDFIDVVTVSGNQITCTCHEANCSQIQTVSRRSIDAANDARRATYASIFDLSYSDAA